MSYKLFLAEAAQTEYREAYGWYENQSVGLGSDFESNVDECLNNISTIPEAYSRIGKTFRQANVTKFPYVIVYGIDKKSQRIIVYSIFHTSRKPKKKYRKL